MRKEFKMFDIVDIAKILEVSEKTIYRYFKKYDSQLRKFITQNEKGNKAINDKGLFVLSKLVGKNIEFSAEKRNEKVDFQITGENKMLLEELRKQIDELKEDKTYLREQNQELKQNISNLTKLLDQEQQIRLYNIKKLEEPIEEKVEVENFKKLNNENFLQKIIELISFKSK